jgi:hypothetical protein
VNAIARCWSAAVARTFYFVALITILVSTINRTQHYEDDCQLINRFNTAALKVSAVTAADLDLRVLLQ